MQLPNQTSIFRRAAGLGATLTLLAFGAPALADKQQICMEPKPDMHYTDLVFDPTIFGVESAEDDAGSAYEMQFAVHIVVQEFDRSKPNWTGPEICRLSDRWSRDLDIWSGVIPEFREYKLPQRYVLKNIPRDSIVFIRFVALEDDDVVDEIADFSRFPDSDNGVDITVYVGDWKAQTMTGFTQNAFDINFGLAKRLKGDGHIAGFDRNESFRAILDFVVDLSQPEIRVATPAPPPTPTPDNRPGCKNYAVVAVEQFSEANSLSCGFSGPEWSGDHQMHFDWCAHGSNEQSFAAQSITDRETDLIACRKSSPAANTACSNYALKAVEQFNEARSLNCGLTGPEWSGDHQAHFDWCAHGANAQSLAPQGTRDRQIALDACKQASIPKIDPTATMCQIYANEALKIAAQAAALNCGFVGGRWLQDYSVHYNFCIANPNPVGLLSEAAQRDAAYKQCSGN